MERIHRLARGFVIEAVGHARDERAIPVIARLIDEGWPDDHSNFAWALGEIGHEDGKEILQRILASEEQWDRMAARRALIKIRRR